MGMVLGDSVAILGRYSVLQTESALLYTHSYIIDKNPLPLSDETLGYDFMEGR
jgi:hypothetical protein